MATMAFLPSFCSYYTKHTHTWGRRRKHPRPRQPPHARCFSRRAAAIPPASSPKVSSCLCLLSCPLFICLPGCLLSLLLCGRVHTCSHACSRHVAPDQHVSSHALEHACSKPHAPSVFVSVDTSLQAHPHPCDQQHRPSASCSLRPVFPYMLTHATVSNMQCLVMQSRIMTRAMLGVEDSRYPCLSVSLPIPLPLGLRLNSCAPLCTFLSSYLPLSHLPVSLSVPCSFCVAYTAHLGYTCFPAPLQTGYTNTRCVHLWTRHTAM